MKNKIFLIKKINKIKEIIKKIKNKKKCKLYYIIDKKILKKYFKKIKSKKNISTIKNENNKNIKNIIKITNKMTKNKINKNSILVSIGGGVVGDIAGLISKIILRGIKHINIPTTLLAQIDSSIGGKNGINNKYGKNIIGTIKQTNIILICRKFLNTLKRNIYYDGFSEIIKISLINNKKLFKIIYKNIKKIYKKRKKILNKIITKSINSKLKITKFDINDKKERLKLNFGHTFGHAIEKQLNYKISHGKAVIIGIIISLNISYKLRYINKKIYKKIIKLINKIFPKFSLYLKKINTKITKNIKYDKKTLNDNFVRIVLLKKIGKVFIKKINIKYIKKTIKKIKRFS
ncbi:MAG: 3-dehydroquinate synthase family protein [Candidatus Vidania fulgoroideorum]